MYFANWEDFSKASEALFVSEPDKTRCTMKYRHCDATFVMKVTDDKSCLKFRTNEVQDVKRMERLTLVIMQKAVEK